MDFFNTDRIVTHAVLGQMLAIERQGGKRPDTLTLGAEVLFWLKEALKFKHAHHAIGDGSTPSKLLGLEVIEGTQCDPMLIAVGYKVVLPVEAFDVSIRVPISSESSGT